jgi:hypothetical protein
MKDSTNHSSAPRKGKKPAARRGRPLGSVSLTAETQETIVLFLRAGAFESAAAEAAEISIRTFHEWMKRGHGDHSRPITPKLRAFARAVDKARAEARIAAEVRVYKSDPKFWLRYAARSKPEANGWTDLADSAEVSAYDELMQRIEEAEADEATEANDGSHRGGSDE